MRTTSFFKLVAAALLLAATIQPLLAATADADAGGDGNSRAAGAGQALLGQSGPAAVLTTIDGKRIDLAALYGKKPVYLKFWATWCVPCREQMPGFERLYQKYGDRIAVVAVNTGFSETESDVRAYRARHGLHMPIVIDDGSLARRLNLRVTPQHVVIGADGRIVHVGHLADRRLDDALARVAAQQPVAQPVPLAPQPAGTKALKPGDDARGIALTTIDGQAVPLGAGRPHALLFFSPWCETYLRESRPATARACRRVRLEADRLARTAGVDWIGVSAPVWATAGELADYARTTKTRIPLALDRSGDVFGAFGIRRIPSVVLVDARGRVARVLGPDDQGIAQAVRALRAR